MSLNGTKMTHTETKPAHPYPDYVEEHDESTHQYLHCLLKLNQPERILSAGEALNVKHEIMIADIIENIFIFHSFSPPRVGLLDNQFSNVLDKLSPGSRTRIVAVNHGILCDTNRFYLNALGWKFELKLTSQCAKQSPHFRNTNQRSIPPCHPRCCGFKLLLAPQVTSRHVSVS
ncbi:hypothetical protein BDZ45DRAFT_269562 [Acephala macrosclerotiorum]|nr:hypothetical protein BDZ45DRAFT_269562 [Acephala macrosclerotiorum]